MSRYKLYRELVFLERPPGRRPGSGRVRILFAGPPRTFTITGIAQFGTADNLAGATLAAFTLPTAQAVPRRRAGSMTSTW